MSLKNLYKKIDKVKVVSFDIFDTLLLRPYMNPADMFKHIGKIYSAPYFYKERINAESIFYQKNNITKEANIDDIYSVIPQFMDIKEFELKFEYQILSLNTEIKKVYDYALNKGKTIIIASDMYLPYEFIEKILKKNNIDNYHKLYLSNRINKRKDRGDMYDFIIKDLNINPKDILHIGDNKKSDYKQALKHKLNAYLYPAINSGFLKKNRRFKDLYKNNKDSLGLSILLATLAQSEKIEDYWINFGFSYAGIVAFSYAKMIYDNARKENLKDVLFVARDGYLIEKVFNTFNKEINTHYVYAPRILNYTANLDFDSSQKEQPKIICNYFKQNTNGKPCDEYIKDNIALFTELAKKEKQEANYKNYIQSLVCQKHKIGVVDTISKQLSAQKLIQNESEIKTTGFYFLTLAGHSIANELEHHDFLANELRNTFVQNYKCDLIELIFSAPENPVVTVKNGRPVYQDNISEDEKNRHLIYKKIESGVLHFVNTIINRFNSCEIFFENQDIFELLEMYVNSPTYKDIKAMYKVKRSPYADNSLYVPLLCADVPFWQIKKYRKLPWHSPLQHLFCVLAKPVSFRIKFFKYFKVILFPLLKRNIFKCCFMDNIGFYIGGGKNV